MIWIIRERGIAKPVIRVDDNKRCPMIAMSPPEALLIQTICRGPKTQRLMKVWRASKIVRPSKQITVARSSRKRAFSRVQVFLRTLKKLVHFSLKIASLGLNKTLKSSRSFSDLQTRNYLLESIRIEGICSTSKRTCTTPGRFLTFLHTLSHIRVLYHLKTVSFIIIIMQLHRIT